MVIEVRHGTCRGARHLSRGEPCQDASSSCSGVSADGTPYGLLVVADGHGHPRHSRSGVGASLACALSQQLALDRLMQSGGQADLWPAWFRDAFPTALNSAWKRDVARHAQQHYREPEADLISYGTTLGMALLTPHWWLCAGLGDWDLVLLTETDASLVSEERSSLTPGESTFSLCQTDPLGPMAARFQMARVNTQQADLVLCTDGIRKSCQNDADFLILCKHLAKLDPAGQNLQYSLQKITSKGSGDDVSVALAGLQIRHPDGGKTNSAAIGLSRF